MTETPEETRTQETATNTGLGAAAQQPKGTMNVQEIKDKIYQGGPGSLLIEELKYYMDETSKEDEATGSLKQDTKSSVARRNDLEKAQLKEEDVIDALYHALIDLGLEGEKLFRREMIYWKDKAKAAIADGKASGPSEHTFKLDKDHEDAHVKTTVDTIDEKKISKKIYKAIKKGTLLDDKNKDLYNHFKEMVKDDPKGQEILANVEEKCATYKRHPEGAEAEANKEACAGAANAFLVYSVVTMQCNESTKHSALDFAYGECCHRNDLNSSQMEAFFKSSEKEYSERLRATTDPERIATIDRLTREIAGNDKLIETIMTQHIDMPVTDNLRKMSQLAMKQGLFHGKETDFNAYLDTAREFTGMKPRVVEQRVVTGGTLEDVAKQFKQHDPVVFDEDVKKRMEELDNKANSPRRHRLRERISNIRNHSQNSNKGQTNENGNDNSPRKNKFLNKRLGERE